MGWVAITCKARPRSATWRILASTFVEKICSTSTSLTEKSRRRAFAFPPLLIELAVVETLASFETLLEVEPAGGSMFAAAMISC